MFYQEDPSSTHDALLLFVSDLVGLERQIHRLQPLQVRRELRQLATRLSDFLPEVEELEELEDRIGRLEQRMRDIKGGSSGSSDFSSDDDIDFI